MSLAASELILNPDQSIYHLNLLPEDIADTIIIVGDPNRVPQVSAFFDTIELKKEKREFHTHTGTYKGKRITALSTGIGTDNIDIVFNELDALANVDFKTRTIKEKKKVLEIIRVGTSGSIQPEIPVDSFVLSEFAIGFDNLIHFYQSKLVEHPKIQRAFMEHTQWNPRNSDPYVVSCDEHLADRLSSDQVIKGFTGTNVGFYGPQGRQIRLTPFDADLNEKMANFNFKGLKITNLEMETSAIYGLGGLLGHKTLSMNCILANRPNGTFSTQGRKSIDALIKYTLDKLAE
ncbi:nucleoside phosphorylase [Sediminicola luteus]|uniref:Uridine phosphorylase n=1 Tax=Sediminicola luteus TaxID=319238 RepID=A0A2A4G8R5_9FLAO|nr:nucleoside phosphorylase [Sediminicola luteus]PCE64162.1 phosphorylase [Sediminicola luteus]